EKLAALSPADIRDRGLFPKGFLPLPHVKHDVGGMVFPPLTIKELPRLQRFDVDFDLPDHFLPEFPPALFLTTRPDLGDVSQGKLITVENFQEIFGGILNAKDLEGLRLLVTQFPQQQFNATADRKTTNALGIQGVACFGCQVHFMAELQELLDFPPAPSLGLDGKLDPKKFADDTPEMKGQKLFFGKAQCSTCHPAPYYTDNLMHDLKVDRFYKTQTINGL